MLPAFPPIPCCLPSLLTGSGSTVPGPVSSWFGDQSMCDVGRAVGVVAPVHRNPERQTVKLSTVPEMDLLGKEKFFRVACPQGLLCLSCYRAISDEEKKVRMSFNLGYNDLDRPPKSQGINGGSYPVNYHGPLSNPIVMIIRE